MIDKVKSIVLAEIVKNKKGEVLASRQYNHTINFNHREIECETAEVIQSKNKSVVVDHSCRRFKSPRSKVVRINLLTGTIS